MKSLNATGPLKKAQVILFHVEQCLSAEIHKQNSQIRRADSRNTGSAGKRFGFRFCEFLAGFATQGFECVIIEVIRYGNVMQSLQFVSDCLFLFNVSRILYLNLNSLQGFNVHLQVFADGVDFRDMVKH